MPKIQGEKIIRADQTNCTYWWIMKLDQRDTRNSINLLYGYSKLKNDAEAKDKIDCLCKRIKMLNAREWIDKSLQIDIYKKLGAYPDVKTDRHIITLYKNDYLIPIDIAFKMPMELKNYLNALYKEREKEPVGTKHLINLDHLDKIKDLSYSKDTMYDLSKHFFRRLKDLHDWCILQIESGENREIVMNFYRNYSSKHLLKE